jgi:hypothetical protein
LTLLQELPGSVAWSSAAHSADVVRLLLILLQNPLNSDLHGLGVGLIKLLTTLVLKLNRQSLRLLISWLTDLRPEVFGARVVRPIQALLTRLAKDAQVAAASAAREAAQQLPAGSPAVLRAGLSEFRADILPLCRLLDVLQSANVQVVAAGLGVCLGLFITNEELLIITGLMCHACGVPGCTVRHV